MFLKNVRLKSFKCHEDLFLDFSPGDEDDQPVRRATFLVGETGTGKTALLQAIALITGGSAILRFIPGFPNDFIQLGKRFALLEATVITQDGKEQPLSLRLMRDQSPADVQAANKDSLARIDALLHQPFIDKLPRLNYFTGGYGPIRSPDTSGNPGKVIPADYRAIRSLFETNGLRTGLGGNLQAFKKLVNSFLPPDIRFQGSDKKTGQLLFKTSEGNLPVHMLGGGHQQTVAWISNLLYELDFRFGHVKDPLAAGGLLLISEIDLHLHPAWQRFIPQLLKEFLPNFQIIATTYSPHIAQQAGPGELYALRRDEGRLELIPFQGDPSRMLLHQLLMSPIFGLATDESLKVERAKGAVREAALSGGPQATGSFESALKYLPDMANTRSNSGAVGEDMQLLLAINAALQSGKKGGRQ